MVWKEGLSREEFLDKKRDFSHLLVHLTRAAEFFSAKEVLECILEENTLRAFSSKYCLFGPNLESQSGSLQDEFKVVCFTETPIDQIEVLLTELERDFKPEPYGLVFQKEYVKKRGGNPVFYTPKEIAKPLWQLYWPLCSTDTQQSSKEICRLLALVTVCEEGNDWHWEREWRTVGDLGFTLSDIYCGLCPEEDIAYFESKYSVVFLSPFWGLNKILDKLVGK